MTVEISNLFYKINEKLSENTLPINVLFLAKSAENLETGKYFTVKTLNDLPNAEESETQLIYVIEEDTFFVSNGSIWNQIATE